MRDQRDKSFWSEFFKWFLIWNLVSLICRGIIFLFKIYIIAIKRLIELSIAGIKKAYPIIKNKFKKFKQDYNQKYKPRIDEKVTQVANFFLKVQSNEKKKINAIKVRIKKSFSNMAKDIKGKSKSDSFKMIKKLDSDSNTDIKLKIRKARYSVIDFYYNHEIQILLIVVIVIVFILIFVMILTLTNK